jgi:small subunit ribosomal protein S13
MFRGERGDRMDKQQGKPEQGKPEQAKPGKAAKPEKVKPEQPKPEAKPEVDKDLKYFVRMRNTDLDGTKSVHISLTKIEGIGRATARVIARLASVDPLALMGKLPDADTDRLRKVVEAYGPQVPRWMLNRPADIYTGEGKHLMGTDVMITRDDDVNRMRKIRCYRGIRHETGQKVRGQRTKSTGRTGTTVGVRKTKESQVSKG